MSGKHCKGHIRYFSKAPTTYEHKMSRYDYVAQQRRVVHAFKGANRETLKKILAIRRFKQIWNE